MSLVNRLALASCASTKRQCDQPCRDCRIESAAVARELADWLDERFGYSETANLIRGVLPEVPHPQRAAGGGEMTTADRQDAIETACHNAIRAMHDQAAIAHRAGRSPEACLILAGALTQLVAQEITGEELSSCMAHLTRQATPRRQG